MFLFEERQAHQIEAIVYCTQFFEEMIYEEVLNMQGDSYLELKIFNPSTYINVFLSVKTSTYQKVARKPKKRHNTILIFLYVLPYDKRKLSSKNQVLGRGEGHCNHFLRFGYILLIFCIGKN